MKSIQYLRGIFVLALVAMLGSLYFSTFGDPIANILAGHLFAANGFEPCHLCRWARILMYPLVLISGIALLRKDEHIAYTILPFSIAGVLLTSYHYSIQYLNSLNVFSCAPGNPCTTIDWKIFGFVTIPALAWVSFVAITVLAILLITNKKKAV